MRNIMFMAFAMSLGSLSLVAGGQAANATVIAAQRDKEDAEK